MSTGIVASMALNDVLTHAMCFCTGAQEVGILVTGASCGKHDSPFSIASQWFSKLHQPWQCHPLTSLLLEADCCCRAFCSMPNNSDPSRFARALHRSFAASEDTLGILIITSRFFHFIHTFDYRLQGVGSAELFMITGYRAHRQPI